MKFKTVLSDSPWTFNDSLDKTRKKPYETLSFEDLKNLPIKDIVAEEAHLYLWIPSTLLEWGFPVIKSWGFDFKTIVVWNKLTKNGKNWFGMGHYFRNTVEVCLFGTRNNFKLKTKNTRNSFESIKPGRHHAAKPDEFYEIIENNSFGPYLELFATQKRKGWISLGNEINGKDIREELKKIVKYYEI